jgi:Zn-dependent protease
VKWSFSIGRLAGIDVRVHATFFLLLAWVAYGGWAEAGSVAGALAGVTLVLSLFFIVVLHELGHALAARHYGIPTRDITLLPIGGVARIERMPDEPRHELVVAVAGPAVNVVLAVGLAVILAMLDRPWYGNVAAPSVWAQLLWINVTLAVFNMIPAFPMDGGRALRAILAMRIDTVRATEIAARLGKITAFALGLIGLFASPVLLLIALFVWLGAQSEVTAARFEGALSGLSVAAATIREFHTLSPRDRLEVAAAHAIAGFQHDFPVLDGGVVVGVLPHRALLSALTRRGLRTRSRIISPS